MPAFPSLPPGRCGVATSAELAAAGWTEDAGRHAVRTGRLERIVRGHFAPPPLPESNEFARAELRLVRRAVAATLSSRHVAVSHLAAALHRRLPVWADDPQPCVCTWNPHIRRVSGVHVHRLLDTTALVVRGGVPVTSVARTIVDIACEFGPEAALVTGDAALRDGSLTRDALDVEVHRARGLTGVEHARGLCALLDPAAESPLESRGRWKFHVHGIEPPLSQIRLYTREGRFLGRVDHFWAEGTVGEADGTLKYRNPADPLALVHEKRRQQDMEDVDLQFARWAARDMPDFSAAAARIERARGRARRRLGEGDLLWYALDRHGARVPVPGAGSA